jgi:hypothetical protein
MFLQHVCSVYQTTRRHVLEDIYVVLTPEVTPNSALVKIRAVKVTYLAHAV